MKRLTADQPLVPSILDRLIDDDPEITTEPTSGRAQRLRELKQSVRRDLEWLLNTRPRGLPSSGRWPELVRSILTYGLPDFGGAGPAGQRNRAEFCASMAQLIRQHEPRLMDIAVVELREPDERQLQFRIDALLRVDPAPEPVVFDTLLESSTGAVVVRGEAA
jgi:type VI secretion system protein ImpF